MYEHLQDAFESLAAAIVEQAAKDYEDKRYRNDVKKFFTDERSNFNMYMPNTDGKEMYEKIKQNYKEYGTYRRLIDPEIETKWNSLKKIGFKEGKLNRDWFIFQKGDKKEKIYEWFDQHYSKGLDALLNKRNEVAC